MTRNELIDLYLEKVSLDVLGPLLKLYMIDDEEVTDLDLEEWLGITDDK